LPLIKQKIRMINQMIDKYTTKDTENTKFYVGFFFVFSVSFVVKINRLFIQ
jgi:hypothetical protein